MVFLIVLGILDLISGLLLGLSGTFNFEASTFVFFLGIVMLIKGVYSVGAGMASGFWFDILGILDVATGIILILINMGWMSEIFVYLGIIIVLKGLYSFVIGYTNA